MTHFIYFLDSDKSQNLIVNTAVSAIQALPDRIVFVKLPGVKMYWPCLLYLA